MSNLNRFGLPRTIPSAVKRTVRKRCGFGCVICGLAIYDYEHFSPEFHDALAHREEGITLLCPTHHRQKTSGRLSLQSVREANDDPFCLRSGFASEAYDMGATPLTIRIGGWSFTNVQRLIQINGIAILSLLPPEVDGAPFRLSGTFTNSLGQVVLRINDNEFHTMASNWDVEATGANTVLRSAPGKIALQIRVEPPHLLFVERIDMTFMGVSLRGNSEVLEISMNGGASWSRFQGCSAVDCLTGLCFEQRQSLPPGFGTTSLHYQR